MSYKIESGVPVPEGAPEPGNIRYPFRMMKVGDSFWVDGKEAFERARKSAYTYQRRNPDSDAGPMKFRSLYDSQKKGGRIWRIE